MSEIIFYNNELKFNNFFTNYSFISTFSTIYSCDYLFHQYLFIYSFTYLILNTLELHSTHAVDFTCIHKPKNRSKKVIISIALWHYLLMTPVWTLIIRLALSFNACYENHWPPGFTPTPTPDEKKQITKRTHTWAHFSSKENACSLTQV